MAFLEGRQALAVGGRVPQRVRYVMRADHGEDVGRMELLFRWAPLDARGYLAVGRYAEALRRAAAAGLSVTDFFTWLPSPHEVQRAAALFQPVLH
jgi:hypothetical protein